MKKLLTLLGVFAIILSCSSDETPIKFYTITIFDSEGGSVSSKGGVYEEGEVFYVTAVPDLEFVFSGWSNGSNDNPLMITASDNIELTANFIKKTYPLTVSVEGEGDVIEKVINSGKNYSSGTIVELTALPNLSKGWQFSGWSGANVSFDNPIQLTVNTARSITARFNDNLKQKVLGKWDFGGLDNKSKGNTSSSNQECIILSIVFDSDMTFKMYLPSVILKGDFSISNNTISLSIENKAFGTIAGISSNGSSLVATFNIDGYCIKTTVSRKAEDYLEGTTYVPDNMFEQHLIDLGLDEKLDDYVVTENITGVEEINLSQVDGDSNPNIEGIKDLTGIEDFKALKRLLVFNQPLEALKINNLDLYTLVLHNISSNLTSIDLTPFQNIDYVGLAGGNFGEIIINGSSSLRRVIIFNSSISSIDFSNCQSLSSVSLDANLKLDNLVFENNDSLTELSVKNSPLENLNLLNLSSLSNLNLNQNKLSSLNLSSLNSLENLSVNRNKLTYLDLTSNTNLTSLSLGSMTISGINDYTPDPSIVLNNIIEDINLTENTKLKSLTVTSIGLKSLDLSALNELEYLEARNNELLNCIKVNESQLADIESKNWIVDSSTTSFSLDCRPKTYVPDDNFEQYLIDLGLDEKLDDYVVTESISSTISLGGEPLASFGKKIKDLTGIEDFVSLKNLYMSGNELEVIDLSKNIHLETVSLDYNKLTAINISNNRSLKSFSAIGNPFTIDVIDLSNNSNLEAFMIGGVSDVNGNYGTTTTLQTASKTLEINTVRSNISNIVFSSNSLLNHLVVSDSKLEVFDVNFISNVKSLNLSGNLIESLNLDKFPSLENLYIQRNNFSSLDVSSLSSLTLLIALENNLTCVNVNEDQLINIPDSWILDSSVVFSLDCNPIEEDQTTIETGTSSSTTETDSGGISGGVTETGSVSNTTNDSENNSSCNFSTRPSVVQDIDDGGVREDLNGNTSEFETYCIGSNIVNKYYFSKFGGDSDLISIEASGLPIGVSATFYDSYTDTNGANLGQTLVISGSISNDNLANSCPTEPCDRFTITYTYNCGSETSTSTRTGYYKIVDCSTENSYNTVTIGSQVWFAENLKETKYQNGDSITKIEDNNSWNNTSSAAYSYFNNDSSNVVLYNWAAASNNKNICPQGFRVPTREDFETLFSYVKGDGSYDDLYNRLSPGGSSGFNANELLYRGGGGNNGSFLQSGQSQYWTSSSRVTGNGRVEYFALIGPGNVQVNTYNLNVENYGYCVRCIQN